VWTNRAVSRKILTFSRTLSDRFRRSR
jgi:hypothetical protein